MATQKIPTIKLKKGEVLVLRTCEADGTSYNNFKWPQSGPVNCPDWKPKAECGNGLHGLLWGAGKAGYLSGATDAAWLVVRVKEADIVDIDQKVKFPSGEVVYFGEKLTAIAIIQTYAPAGTSVVWGTATAGDWGTATAGYRGTATAGYRGTATAGYGGTATAGYGGTATAGDWGTATAGDGGTATAGDRGTATAGEDGVIAILYWNGEKYKRAIFNVGENGVDANQPYQVDKNGNPLKAKVSA